jgi:hypothetical protein
MGVASQLQVGMRRTTLIKRVLGLFSRENEHQQQRFDGN